MIPNRVGGGAWGWGTNPMSLAPHEGESWVRFAVLDRNPEGCRFYEPCQDVPHSGASGAYTDQEFRAPFC